MELKFTTEDREEVLRLLSNRSYLGVRGYLNQLSEAQKDNKYEEFHNKIKSLLMNTGKSNVIMKEDIENIFTECDL